MWRTLPRRRGEHDGRACKAQMVRQLTPAAVHSGPPNHLCPPDARMAQQQAEQPRSWRCRLRKGVQRRCCVQRRGAQHAPHARQVAQGCALTPLHHMPHSI
jgi:hypothetical protein